jgi:hypothetical protein
MAASVTNPPAPSIGIRAISGGNSEIETTNGRGFDHRCSSVAESVFSKGSDPQISQMTQIEEPLVGSGKSREHGIETTDGHR